MKGGETETGVLCVNCVFSMVEFLKKMSSTTNYGSIEAVAHMPQEVGGQKLNRTCICYIYKCE